jgi:hypothetical protein
MRRSSAACWVSEKGWTACTSVRLCNGDAYVGRHDVGSSRCG